MEKKKGNEQLAKLVKEARGEDRSIREYAGMAGITPSTISRTEAGEYTPGVKTLAKLVSDEAKPRGNVTLSDLMAAAGYEAIKRLSAYVSAFAEEQLNERGGDSAQESSRERHDRLLQAQSQFEKMAMGLIYGELAKKGIVFQNNDQHKGSIFGDVSLKLTDMPVDTWDFAIKHFEDVRYGNMLSIIRHVVCRQVFRSADKTRKVSIVVDNEDAFNMLADYKGKNCFRGDMSKIANSFLFRAIHTV